MKKIVLLVFLVALSSLAFANTFPINYTIDFEQYSAYTQITNQYAAQSILFTNSLQLVEPSYDYFDYPPHSGLGVITNDPNDPIQANFTAGVLLSSVSFWYASPGGIVATAYNAGGTAIDTVAGAPVDGSNNWLTFSGPGLVSWFTVSANLGADSVTVDDLKYSVVPEPSSLALLGSGAFGLAAVLRRRFSR